MGSGCPREFARLQATILFVSFLRSSDAKLEVHRSEGRRPLVALGPVDTVARFGTLCYRPSRATNNASQPNCGQTRDQASCVARNLALVVPYGQERSLGIGPLIPFFAISSRITIFTGGLRSLDLPRIYKCYSRFYVQMLMHGIICSMFIVVCNIL